MFLLGLHVIWCPKYRKRVLTGDVAARLKELIAEIADDRGWKIQALEVMPDHVHLFVLVTPSETPSYAANQFKGRTSRALRSEFRHLRSSMPSMWTRSYFVTSVGQASAATIQRYIEEQTTKPTVGKP